MRREVAGLWCVATAIALASCSSDGFGPTGSGLPAEVSQDSLGVVISVVGAVEERTIEPPQDQALEERELLFLGQKQSSGWRATPLLRFDFTSVDTIDPRIAAYLTSSDSLSQWRASRLELNLRSDEPNEGILRQIDIHDLADTLNVSMVGADLSTVQGTLLESVEDDAGSVGIAIDRNIVFNWIVARAHRGIALVDQTPPDTSSGVGNMVAYVSGDDPAPPFISGADTSFVQPEVVVELPVPPGVDASGESVFVAFPVLLDFTLFEVPDEGDAVALGSHLTSRPWLRFDLSSIPPSASINGATLTLCVDFDRSLLNKTLFISAFAMDEVTAESGETAEDDEILGSAGLLVPGEMEFVVNDTTSIFFAVPPRSFDLDVTDYIQRSVNGTLDSATEGISIISQLELLDLQRAVIFGSNAPVDTLRPRLDITFTPPIDFEE